MLFARDGREAGIYVVGVEGGAPRKVREGRATDLRWAPGPPLPP